MHAIPELIVVGLLATVGQTSTADSQPSPPPSIRPHDRVDVTDDTRSIRGRLTHVTADTIVLQTADGRVTLPFVSVQRIDRIGDSLVNGAATGAALGGATALGLMAKACSNSNCSNIPANLDPRMTLLGAVTGAGIGALIDAIVERRITVYRSGGADQPPVFVLQDRPPWTPGFVFLARAGGGQVNDDEGAIGTGATLGAGVRVPIGRRTGLQIAYDRHKRTRNFEFGRRFAGTEQLVTAKMLWFFRSTERVRPYVAAGIGIIDSTSRSDSPTYTLGPRNIVMPGPVETSRSRSRGAALGFGVGMDARMARRLSILGDLTVDLGHSTALASTRLTVGAGWRF